MVGFDGKKAATFAASKAAALKQFFDALCHKLMPKQHAFLLLRLSAMPRLNFLCRTLPLRVVQDACGLFDKLVVATALHLLQIPDTSLSPVALTQIRLPLRFGGLGLRSLVDTAQAAYLASIAASASFLLPFSDPQHHSLTSDLEDSIEHFQHCPDLKFPAPDGFVKYFADPPANSPLPSAKLQKRLLIDLALSQLRQLKKENVEDETLIAHLTSLSQKGASLWLSTTPFRPEFEFRDEDFLLALRVRLRLDPAPDMPSHCFCGTELTTPDHFFVCVNLRRRAITQRHDSIAHFLHNFLRRAEAEAELEPRLMAQSRIRPDLSYSLPRQFDQPLFLLDVSILHPTAISNLQLSMRPLGASAHRAQAKIDKYADLVDKLQNAERIPVVFIPFILESTGAVWHTVPRTLAHIAEHGCVGDFDNFSPAQVRRYLSRVVAILVQKGNANALRQGLFRSRAVRARVSVDPAGRRHLLSALGQRGGGV